MISSKSVLGVKLIILDFSWSWSFAIISFLLFWQILIHFVYVCFDTEWCLIFIKKPLYWKTLRVYTPQNLPPYRTGFTAWLRTTARRHYSWYNISPITPDSFRFSQIRSNPFKMVCHARLHEQYQNNFWFYDTQDQQQTISLQVLCSSILVSYVLARQKQSKEWVLPTSSWRKMM